MGRQILDREAILRAIENWPVEDQVRLAREILDHAQPESDSSSAPRESTWDALYGAASNGQEPPTDEVVAQWLDERRERKYGSFMGALGIAATPD